jgi:hypothetical protein
MESYYLGLVPHVQGQLRNLAVLRYILLVKSENTAAVSSVVTTVEK